MSLAALEKIDGKDVFLMMKQEVADFTSGKGQILMVMTKELRMEIPLPHDKKTLISVCSHLIHYLSGPNRVLIGWNLKTLFSYLLARTGKHFHLDGKFFDLKILEWYIGKDEAAPANFRSALERLSGVLKHPSWVELKTIYSSIYKPLITDVIPDIETLGVVNHSFKKRVHSCYDIAGQINGRMRCSKAFQNSFNPHSTSPEERQQIRPPLFDSVFIYLDYRHMEVSMLQWLSGDPVLGKIIDSGNDVYSEIWTVLTGLSCNDKYRQKSKGIFLPVVYGMQAETLSTKMEISMDVSRMLVERIYARFPNALGWVRNAELAIKSDGICDDVFLKRRIFGSHESYKARNFIVQSPASLYCLEKLVHLHKDIAGKAKLGFHVHDGYVVCAQKHESKKIQDIATQSLESDSVRFPNLKLKVSCRVGETLSLVA